MWHPKTRLVLVAIAAGFGLVGAPRDANADDQRWCSYAWESVRHRSSAEWAAEAAAVGVVGGAPGLGFCRSVAGYDRAIIRIPFPNQGMPGVDPGNLPNSTGLPPGVTPAPMSFPAPPAPTGVLDGPTGNAGTTAASGSGTVPDTANGGPVIPGTAQPSGQSSAPK